ncbi:TonB-linked outer membrane protein, SusC/RagA family [Sphingobacterium nematocida]|uniref:TonB-linked outer membrane protein, SusC/RagA family n=1 Tax=Sphingobacterium nematocida TaxID=1513896 RepID=A0A1T5EYM6_9SPHI|nr:SusC/RagA family TonB-linked outer membrane protein [Sphingobacterium nematocida]SKB89035.1 TonB-linked outer membrane protein, SusC/RagA family [Sphingobacterium nematocida]
MKQTLLFLMALCSISLAIAQTGLTITGTIKDNLNRPISNASVLIKGTNVGTESDAGGNFDIKSNSNNVTLIISAVGYEDQEIGVKDSKKLNIILADKEIGLDEVVVMGYNAVEKQHVASSVAQLDMTQTKSRPIMKMQQAFSGTIAGVTMMQGNSLPGSTFGGINIRGISTLQNAAPLVLVDGMEMDISDLDPNQIKSLTVLKDAASASMYGSRGANGVIVIETERGTTGQFKVNVNAWSGFNKAIDLPDFVNAAQYMRLNNEARGYQGQSLTFTDEDILKAQNGEIKSVDWMKEVMQKTSMTHNQSANIAGGGGVGTFNLMLGHLKETGLNSVEGSQKFTARFNTNVNIANKFVLLADFYAQRLQNDRLLANDDGNGLYKIAWRMNPTQQVYYDSDIPEHYILHNDLNPVARINRGGIKNYMHDKSAINLRPRYNISEKVNIEGNVSYHVSKSAHKEEVKSFKYLDATGKPIQIVSNAVKAEQGVSESQLTARALVNYTDNLRGGKDKVYFTAGTEVMDLTYTDYKQISKASFFGKLNYSFDNRYILEVTGRGDGSSKFAPGHKWGFFPSAAVAWNAHNESFMEAIKEIGAISNLKFRGSYGLIGNENVDPYLWEEVVNNYGWTMRVPNPNFSWEKQKQWNIGVDVTTLKNRLTFTAEVYDKFSYDLIYSKFPVPPLTGSHTLTTSVNIGEVRNKGFELSANWNDRIGNVEYTVGGTFFDNKNEVLKAGYSSSDTLVFTDNTDKIWYKGISIDNYYGFETNGFFADANDVANTAAKMPNTLPGDIKYVDQNGDGLINDADRVYLGDPSPRYNYSVNLSLRYKGFDFSALGQGVGKRTARLGGQEGYPVLVDGSTNALGAPRQYYADNRWTAEHQNSRFPRVWTGTSTNTYLSDVWLGNAAFFRIKVLQLGYTFKNIGKAFHNTRIYVNAQDAITFTKWEGLEPERNGGDGNYPRMATYTFGVSTSIF